MLVPDAVYPQVADWVDKTHLKGRLVYFRVREFGQQVARREPGALHPRSLVRKLVVKPDSPFYDWLDNEVAVSYTHLDVYKRQLFGDSGCVSQRGFRSNRQSGAGVLDERGHPA